MCGFVGFIGAPGAHGAETLEQLAGRMASRLESRGPDDAGTWVSPAAGIALGHRRLSIIDLSAAGRQPMVSASGRSVIAYNGEVYNFAEVRRDLEAKGRLLTAEEIMHHARRPGGPVAAAQNWGLIYT